MLVTANHWGSANKMCGVERNVWRFTSTNLAQTMTELVHELWWVQRPETYQKTSEIATWL